MKAIILFGIIVSLAIPSAAIAQGRQPSDPQALARNQQIGIAKFNSVLAATHTHVSVQTPSNFPVPTYPSNLTRSSFGNSTQGTPTAVLGVATKDSPDTVFQWYQRTLRNSGWSLQTASPKLLEKINQQGRLYIINADKDKSHVSIFIVLDKTTGGTKININWTKAQ